MTIIRTNFTKFAVARTATTFESLAQVRSKVKMILNRRYQGPRLSFFVVKNKSYVAEAKSHSVAFLPTPQDRIYRVL